MSLLVVALAPVSAQALILPPQTLDGPSSQIGEFGGAAVSADGSGGVVYIKQVEGVPHVFAAQYVGNRWLAPVRVDWDSPYEASYPRIAAANGGELVVVWVTEIAAGQRDLVSSTLDPGSSTFGPPYVVDPDLGGGEGADPSLALASNGQGLVAYRAVTVSAENLHPGEGLRSGDVKAAIRIAVFGGERWSAPQEVNRDPSLSMRAPNEENGPRVAVGRADQAVVAWQEPESNGTARIWARRVFGTTLGLVLQVSPSSYGGSSISEDAGAFALGVSDFGAAEVVSRVAVAPGQVRLFASTMENINATSAAHFSEPASLPVVQAPVGAPSVAIDDRGDFRIAFTTGAAAELLTGGEHADVAPEVALGPALAGPGAGAVTALNQVGGGVSAWPATGGVALREDFPGGGAQAALVSGVAQGPVSGLAAGGSESGEAIVGFREGNPGSFEIVGERVSVPPPPLLVEVPRGWVRPREARVGWSNAEDATGGVTYSLVIDGHVVLGALHGESVLPDSRLLGSGERQVQVLATDASGQQTLSAASTLKVDGDPPVASVRHARGRVVIVRVTDAQSGALARATRISFGDGAHANGRLTVRHRYARPGRYTIVARMRDKVGNEGTAYLRVSVR
jgi:hypothetical protein